MLGTDLTEVGYRNTEPASQRSAIELRMRNHDQATNLGSVRVDDKTIAARLPSV